MQNAALESAYVKWKVAKPDSLAKGAGSRNTAVSIIYDFDALHELIQDNVPVSNEEKYVSKERAVISKATNTQMIRLFLKL